MKLTNRKEKRAMKRHRIPLPVHVRVSERPDKAIDLLGISIRDISGMGAFINSVQSGSEGQPVEIDIMLPFSKLRSLNTTQPSVSIRGEIIRVENDGFAVAFSDGHKLSFESDRRQHHER